MLEFVPANPPITPKDSWTESRLSYLQKRGGLKKIGEVKRACRNPSHNPPMHIVLEDGIYEWTCPGCKQTQTFTVVRPIW